MRPPPRNPAHRAKSLPAAAAEPADYRWLIGAEAEKWLEIAASSREPTVRLVAQLRRDLTGPQAHLVLQQVALRAKGREKFAAAGRMFFTPLGLEQATDEAVAAYKAGRFPAGEAVADLCCGIGGDLLGLAGRGAAVGIDRDKVATLLAEANLAVSAGDGRTPRNGSVRLQDASEATVAEFAAWHIDPDRRPEGRRTTRVVMHEPGPAVIERLLAQRARAAIKLAPAAELPDGWSQQAELEWISRKHQCRQLVAWFGDLAASPGERRATLLDAVGHCQRAVTGQPDMPIPVADRVGRFVHEPDAAVLAAGLCGALATEHSLAAVAPDVAYLTGDKPLADPALASFEVLDILPLRIKPLASWLSQRGIGHVEVKKRGVQIEPQEVARQLQGPGDGRATLLIARIGGKQTVMVGRRLANVSGAE